MLILLLLHHLNINDSKDKEVEKFLHKRNIAYTKKSHAELLNENSIRERLYFPDVRNYYGEYIQEPVEIDTEKFDKAYKKSERYIKPNYDINDNSVYGWIKSGLPIKMPQVTIKNCDGKPKIYFKEGSLDYANMRDLGVKSIPFVLDKESFMAAYETGLIKED